MNERGEKIQTRVLTDYLSNLHHKFLAEYPDVQLSFTSFCRIRPKHILTTSFIVRSSCLCTKHQNMALTAKTLKKEGIEVPLNPEVLVRDIPDMVSVKEKLSDQVVVRQWKRVQIEEKGKKKFVTRVVESTLSKDEFLLHLEQQITQFKDHVARVETQYTQMRHLKKHLPPHHVIIQMDFAENYSCKSMDEIQSAYWNQTSVTLHPMVIYFKTDSDELRHKSCIIISDEMGHNSATVITFIKDIIPIVKEIDDGVVTIHYWTDSPTSQYRNKAIFDMVANHQFTFGINARWNYFEAGHGKGPCDGLGGTTKRMADEAVISGHVFIQDATDFYAWAIKSSLKNVQFRFVSSAQVQQVADTLMSKSLKPIKGTMKLLDAVVGMGNSDLMVKDVSCYCDICLSGGCCESWRKESTFLSKVPKITPSAKCSTSKTNPEYPTHEANGNSASVHFQEDDFVAAVYQQQWYIGKVLSVDPIDDEVELSFMERKKMLYQWPRNSDILWVEARDILGIVETPKPTGKTKRMFQLTSSDSERISLLYNEFIYKVDKCLD